MKTKVILQAAGKSKTFIANGRPSDVSDRIVKIKRALGLRLCHGVQAVL